MVLPTVLLDQGFCRPAIVTNSSSHLIWTPVLQHFSCVHVASILCVTFCLQSTLCIATFQFVHRRGKFSLRL